MATEADASGRYRLQGLQPGSHAVRFLSKGYETIEKRIEVTSSDLTLAVQLRPTAIRLHETVVVSPGRGGAQVYDVPHAVSVVTSDALRELQPRTTPEALASLADVWVQKTNHGGGSPLVRGMVGNQVLVMVDGIRLNNSTFRYGPNQYLATVDPTTLAQAEVTHGTGSVLYGSDAIGGTIAVTTASPSFADEGLSASGSFSSRLMTAGMERSGRLQGSLQSRDAAIAGGLSLRHYGDLRAGGGLGVEAPSGYDERNGDVKAVVRPFSTLLLTLAYQAVRQDDVPRFDQVAQRGYATYSFSPQDRDLAYARATLTTGSSWARTLSFTASRQRSDEGRILQKRDSTVRITERDTVDTWGFQLEGRSTGRTWSAVWGIEHYADQVASSGQQTDAATGTTSARRGLYPAEATGSSAAAFLLTTAKRGPLTLELGGRWSRYAFEAEDATFGRLSTRPRALVWSSAVTYEAHARLRLYAAVAQGFRAPNLDDMSTLGRFDSGVEVPSPGLAPERSLTYEVGIKSRAERFATQLSLFELRLDDLIERVRSELDGAAIYEGDPVYQRQNVGKAIVRGFEANVETSLGHGVRAYGGLAYTFGERTPSREPLRRIPPAHGRLGLRWERARFSAQTELLAAAKQTRLSSGDETDHRIAKGGTPGFLVVNVRAAHTLSDRIALTGGIDNALDEPYRIHGSGIDGPGRAAWLATQIRF